MDLGFQTTLSFEVPLTIFRFMSGGVRDQCFSSLRRLRKPSNFSKPSLRSQKTYYCLRGFTTSQSGKESNSWTPTGSYDEGGGNDATPRWRTTPPRMKAPFRSKPPTRKPNDYTVNEDPKLLDQVYVHVLGPNGDQMLTEEVKWLAVTHKSFDHGRRGYNDRLAFFGMAAHMQ